MVYCSNCGTKNDDQARVCIQCGERLYGRRYGRTKREEEMCFGLPSYWGGIVIGVIVILFGLALLLRQVYGIALETWPFIVIFIGILMIAGAITRSLRRRESTNS